jgi:hypothetical protein
MMKSTKMRGKKETFCTLRPGILILVIVGLICMPHMIPATYAQGPSSGIGWHAAMAMGSLAEQENRTKEHRVSIKCTKRKQARHEVKGEAKSLSLHLIFSSIKKSGFSLSKKGERSNRVRLLFQFNPDMTIFNLNILHPF